MTRTSGIIIVGTALLAIMILVIVMNGKVLEEIDNKCETAEIMPTEEEPACYSNNTLYFNIRNTGLKDLSGLKIYLESEYNLSITIKGRYKPGAPIRKKLSFGKQDMKEMKTITIRPIIDQEGKEIVCKEQKLMLKIERCKEQHDSTNRPAV